MANFGILSLIGFLLLLALVIYIVYVASQRAQGRNLKFSVILIAVLAAGGLILNALGRGLVFVPPQERGVVISLAGGMRPAALQPGVHFVAPVIEFVERYSIGQQSYTMSGVSNEGQVTGNDSVSARTSDGQEVFIDATVTYQVDETNVPALHVKWQNRFEEGLVAPPSAPASSTTWWQAIKWRRSTVPSARRYSASSPKTLARCLAKTASSSPRFCCATLRLTKNTPTAWSASR
ncbi:MAG: hypothetical protein HC853_17860 [Anaerolineae bacterium]|nr:hypothetical protein [Anaerolineae bacterium]